MPSDHPDTDRPAGSTAGRGLRLLIAVLAAVGLAVVGPAGCSTTSGVGGDITDAAASVLLPPKEEEQLGDRFSAQVEQELDLHDDENVQQYLQDLGNAAVEAAGDAAPGPIEFEFHVVDKPDVQNAFAGPGGQIYFYSGLLRSADNAAEVMAVMCHEVAHVTERHIANRLVTAYGMQALISAALGENPGLLAQLASSVAGQGFMLKYSRDMEREADLVGFQFMTETAFDPVGFVTYFQKMTGQGPSIPVFLQSHPSPEQRLEYLRAALQTYGNPPGDMLGEDVHRQMMEYVEPPKGGQAGRHP